MKQLFAIAVLGCVGFAQMHDTHAEAQLAAPQSGSRAEKSAAESTALPPAPRGKSSVIGGEIKSVDHVRDVFMLKVYGQHPVKILFDERTQLFVDGKKSPLGDLDSPGHASVQTILDRTDVYALSVHLLSRSPEGEYQGRVVSFDASKGELTLGSSRSEKPMRLLVPMNITITGVGQARPPAEDSRSLQLVQGSLVSVTFEADKMGRGVVSQISVLAEPGSVYVFVGEIKALDMHSGVLVMTDPRDGMSYELSFDSRLRETARTLHIGDHVKVGASFVGDRYLANTVVVD